MSETVTFSRNNIKLGRRLNRIFDEICGEECADIGCDHGKLIVKALINNKIKHGYAIDISPMSLEKAEKLSRGEGVSSRLTLLVGDGAEKLDKKVDTAVIAGMGAKETVKILSQKDFAHRYILSPHQDAQILRRYLAENGYKIIKDYIIFDKKYYPIIVAERGKNNYNKSQYFFGLNRPETKEFDDFVTKRKDSLQKIIEKVGCNANPETLNEWKEIQLCFKKTSSPS